MSDPARQIDLRDGYGIYIYRTILQDLTRRYGPNTASGNASLYIWKILEHLVGNLDGILRTKTTGVGIDGMLGDSVIRGVVGKFYIALHLHLRLSLIGIATFSAHAENIFQLEQPLDIMVIKLKANNNMQSAIRRSKAKKPSKNDDEEF